MRNLATLGAALLLNLLLGVAIAALNQAPVRVRRAEAPVRIEAQRILENQPSANAPAAGPRSTPIAAVPPPGLPALDLPRPTPPALPAPRARIEVAPLQVPAGVALPDTPSAPPVASAEPGTPAVTRPLAGEAVDEPAQWSPANREPVYPRALRRRGAEGEVTVKLLIDEEGRVQDVTLIRVEGGARFGREVLAVARSWRFTPARHEGRPVAVYARKTIAFRISER